MTFSISAKIQDGRQNSGNSTFFTGTISKVSSTQKVQTLLEITLSLRVFQINDIFSFYQNSRWQPKSRSQDICIFAFYAEIQDGRQKWRESDFCEKPPVDSADNLQVRNFVEITLSRTVCQINVFCIFVLRRNSSNHQKMAGK